MRFREDPVRIIRAAKFAGRLGFHFEDPTYEVGRGVTYYAVDHSPSLLWESASFEISKALLPYLPVVMGGPGAWAEEEVIRRAIEIERGVIVNPAILEFQERSERYPHDKTG